MKRLSHRNPLQKVTVRCKSSTKRKVTPSPPTGSPPGSWCELLITRLRLPVQVEEMEEDDFYDDIKRLYNEDTTTTTTIAVHEGAIMSGEGGPGVCSVPLSIQEGSSSPCPPLQPASAS